MTQPRQGRTDTKKTSARRTPKILVGVRVPRNFHNRVVLECRRRKMTLQQLVTSALVQYFKTPPSTNAEEEVTLIVEPSLNRGLTRIWEDYLDKMPLARVGFLAGMMMHDLVFASKTTKPTKKQRNLLRAYAEGISQALAAGSSPPDWAPDPDVLAKYTAWGVDTSPWPPPRRSQPILTVSKGARAARSKINRGRTAEGKVEVE